MFSFWENKPQTLNGVRREHRLEPIPDGDNYLFQEVGRECLPTAQVAEEEQILKIAKEDEDLP